MSNSYRGKNVIITGGLGFIGSSLAIEIVNQGGNVTIIDNHEDLYGGNYFNINSIQDRVDIKEINAVNVYEYSTELNKADYIFHLAAQVSYIDSLSMPEKDLEYNSISTLNILEHLRRNNRDAKVIYASSRMVYGKINTPKVDEFHPTNPLSLYAVHKLTSEKYLQMYANDFDISTTSLRITNPYGPRQQIKHNKYSLVGWFIKEAMDNHEINIYGDGDQYRDYIFIDDIVDGLVAVGLCTKCAGEVYNLGYGESVMFKDMVHMIVDIVGSGKIKHIKWPEDYELVETGHFKVCVGKLSTLIDWKPKYSLHEGIIKTYEYYKEYRDNYSYVRNFL